MNQHEIKRRHDEGEINQREAVRLHLNEFGKINWLDAMNIYRIKRLAARVHELRDTMDIETKFETTPTGKSVAVYHLEDEDNETREA
jgi:hypothetical protein